MEPADLTPNPLLEDEEECEEGPKELPYLFEKELIEKQMKRVYVVEKFSLDAVRKNVQTLDQKFYAREDQHRIDRIFKGEDFHRIQRHISEPVKRTTELGLPRLESQVYGWLPPNKITTKQLSELNFICAPKQRCDMTEFGERLISRKITERQPFYGLRFFVR